GVRRVVLCLGHLGEMIRERVGDGRQFGLDVAYSFDDDRLLGTGGALRRALPLLGPSFFVLYGDSYLDIAFAPVQAAVERAGRLAGYEVTRRFYEIGTPTGLAELDEHLKAAEMGVSDYTKHYYEEVTAVARGIDQKQVDRMIDILVEVRRVCGRLFILGVGG